VWDLSFYIIIFGIIGDRLAHVFLYDWEYYSQNLLDILKIWQGGLAIHGAIFTGILVLFIYARKKFLSFWLLADIFAPALVLGQTIGRWGNYFNQEIYGLPTDLPWGIPINLVNRVKGYESFTHFHPTFLYLSIWCLLIFMVLFFWHKKRIKVFKNTGIIKGVGNIFLSYLFLYSIGRFLVEFIRLDLQPEPLGLRMGQWLSLVTVTLGIGLILSRHFKSKRIEKT